MAYVWLKVYAFAENWFDDRKIAYSKMDFL
jgi:hypothetical protein